MKKIVIGQFFTVYFFTIVTEINNPKIDFYQNSYGLC